MNAHSVCVDVGVVHQLFVVVVVDIDLLWIAGVRVHVPCTTSTAGVERSRAFRFRARAGERDVSQASTPSNVLP